MAPPFLILRTVFGYKAELHLTMVWLFYLTVKYR
jgi:hypothetical protein